MIGKETLMNLSYELVTRRNIVPYTYSGQGKRQGKKRGRFLSSMTDDFSVYFTPVSDLLKIKSLIRGNYLRGLVGSRFGARRVRRDSHNPSTL